MRAVRLRFRLPVTCLLLPGGGWFYGAHGGVLTCLCTRTFVWRSMLYATHGMRVRVLRGFLRMACAYRAWRLSRTRGAHACGLRWRRRQRSALALRSHAALATKPQRHYRAPLPAYMAKTLGSARTFRAAGVLRTTGVTTVPLTKARRNAAYPSCQGRNFANL